MKTRKKTNRILVKTLLTLAFFTPVVLLFILFFTGLSRYQSSQTNTEKKPSKINNSQFEAFSSPLPAILPISLYEDSGGEYIDQDALFKLKYSKETKVYKVLLRGKINKNAGYSVGYPSALWLMGNFSESQRYGQIGICKGDVDFANKGCAEGGIMILYGVPEINGKGGFCDSKYQNIKIDGQDAQICYYPNAFLVTYPKHPQGFSELNILAWHNDDFTQEDAQEVVNSIKFIDK